MRKANPGWIALSFVVLTATALSAVGQTMMADPTVRLAAADSALAQGRQELLDLLSPVRFEKAVRARDDAAATLRRKGGAQIAEMKLKLCAEELAAARARAALVRASVASLLTIRSAAKEAGADTLSAASWRSAEEKLRRMLRERENSATEPSGREVEEIAGIYRAARRDALRIALLGRSRARIAEAERRGGGKLFPSLILRAQQALSRAEANLAQDKLDEARGDADAAYDAATHALALIALVEAAQKTRQPWETALLPYDSVLRSLATKLGGRLDYQRGQVGRQLFELLESSRESLVADLAAQRKTIHALESALAEAQTNLSDAQKRIAELERRLAAVESGSAPSAAVSAERIKRAQELLKPGDALVLPDGKGNAIIRLQGIRFPPNATNLESGHRRILDRVAEAIALFPGAAIRVEGHTDSEGSEQVNLRLSQARADAVAAYLRAKLKLDATSLPAVGLGEAQPIADNNTPQGRARNRRIDIVLSPPK